MEGGVMVVSNKHYLLAFLNSSISEKACCGYRVEVL